MSARDIGTCEWSDILPKREPPEPGWVLLDPEGQIDGVRYVTGVRTAEEAHRTFTPHKRARDKEIRDGWTVRHEQPGDREALKHAIDELIAEGESGSASP